MLIPEAGARTWLVLALVAAWSVRLTVTLTARRLREGHEDPRYTAIRESWGHAFWWKSLFIVFILQAVLQWLIVSGAIAGAAASLQELSATYFDPRPPPAPRALALFPRPMRTQ